MIKVRGNRNRAMPSYRTVNGKYANRVSAPKEHACLIRTSAGLSLHFRSLAQCRAPLFAVVRAARPRESRPEKAAVRDFMGDIEITWPGESNFYLPDR